MSEMSPLDVEILKAKLERLGPTSDTFDGAWMNIGAGDGPYMLWRILQEIDDIVLPARLTLQRGDATLVFDVAGRRLVSIHSIKVPTAADVTLDGSALSPEDAETMQALADSVLCFANLEGVVTVLVERLSEDTDGASVGASTVQLEEAWGLRFELPEGDTPLQTLYLALEEHVAAYVLITEGSIDRFDGDQALFETIEDLIENRLMGYVEQRVAQGYNHGDPSFSAMEGVGPDQEALLVAVYGQEILLAFGRPSLIAEGHKLWRLIS